MHGYLQSHVAWHRVAPVLARDFTVVVPDLRGYGDSIVREEGPIGMSKRAMALDQLATMAALGFDRFAVVGHDRGGRVAYRLALDHPDKVTALVSLTVVPTLEMWERTTKAFAMGAYHWFLFAQPHDLPERLIDGDPGYFFDWTLPRMARFPERLSPEAVSAYRTAFLRPADRRVRCPIYVTWEQGRYRDGETPVDIWRRWAVDVDGGAIDAGHLQAEEASEHLLEPINPFLRKHAASATRYK